MSGIRTFHPRRGRLSGRHHDALDRLMPVYAIPAEGPVDAAALFGTGLPLVLEIGSGMGEATVAMAAADPGRGYLAVEIHTPGVANLLAAGRGARADQRAGRLRRRAGPVRDASRPAAWTPSTRSSPTRGRRPGTTSAG